MQTLVDDVVCDPDVHDFAKHDVAAAGLVWVGADHLFGFAFVTDG